GAPRKPPAGISPTRIGRLKEEAPARGGLPPGDMAPGRPSPGASGPPPRLEQEIRDLLRRRLRVATLVAAAVFATFGWLLLGDVPSPIYTRFSGLTGRLVIAAGFLVAAACAAVRWRRAARRSCGCGRLSRWRRCGSWNCSSSARAWPTPPSSATRR